MKSKTIVFIVVAGFLVLCGALVIDAVRSQTPPEAVPLAAAVQAETTGQYADMAAQPVVLTESPGQAFDLAAVSAEPQTVTLGAVYPDAIQRSQDPYRYKFKVELTTLGAAVKNAHLSEFDDRDRDEPQPLQVIAPLSNRQTVYSLAHTSLMVAPVGVPFGTRSFPLDRLNWQLAPSYENDTAVFEATLFERDTQEPMLRLTRTYRVQRDSYDLVCALTVENLSSMPIQTQFQMNGPGGLTREDTREDTRKVIAAYRKGDAIETRLMTANDIRRAEQEKRRKPTGFLTELKNLFSRPAPPDERLRLALNGARPPLVWTASTNKYFAAVLRPVGETLTAETPVRFDRAVYVDTNVLASEPAETAGATSILQIEPLTLATAEHNGSQQTLTFEMYLGPKDKSIFEANEVYRKLAYFQTIDFRGCCCPSSLISPLAFGIIWLMKAMFTVMGPLGNYGVVIIILVLLVRLIMHPITKRSQVSMMKMQKLGPKMQEIQKKYAGNKQEMQRKTMEMYREMGVSPVAGMLPMFLQMPIWIALWTAVYTSVDLRGAGFLPFWITDLSVPDNLFKFPFDIVIPYFGEYLNLLPLLMGGVMFAQQKLMPTSQAAAQTNPQVAQQQKMMMIMMPLMFPLLLYHGPSGVNLYIMSSIGAGVIEQMVIRKHIREREEMEAKGLVPVTAKTGGKFKKKKPKPMYKFDK